MSNQLTITDEVLNKVKKFENDGQLVLPQNYSASNALKSAYLILQETTKRNDTRSVLETCTKGSIATALLDMVLQGLNPSKKQCYFIPYGNKLTLSKSYLGTVAAARCIPGIEDVKAYCIYEGDEFETSYNFQTGAVEVSKYNPNYENVNFDKMKGAFCVIIGKHGVLHTEIMNMRQIQAAWNQGPTKGNSPAHKNFKDQMAKKTVINRACKLYVNTTNDSNLFAEAFNKTEDLTTEDVIDINDNQVAEEIRNNANKTTIDMDVVETEFNEVTHESEDGPVMEVNEEEVPF